MNQRTLAFQILNATINNGEYAGLMMKNELNKLPLIQRAFVTELVNGVLRHFYELRAQFKDEGKISSKVEIILSMATYERFFLKQKDYVVFNEYPNLVNKKGEKSFISAILHKLNNYVEYLGDDDEKLSIHYSLPLWMIKLIKKQYPQREFRTFLDNVNKIPQVFYRINKRKTNYAYLSDKYDIKIINEDTFTSNQNLINTSDFKEGLFYIQDVNSSKLYHYLGLEKDNTLLDVCSAPGGKLFNALDIIKPTNAYANDFHEHRLNLIKMTAKKLGFDEINYLNHDGRYLKDKINLEFDRILLDVPCSGLGILRRKPDLRYHIKPENLDELQLLQMELVENNIPLLKKGGILVYSTCTINKKENERQVAALLERHSDMHLLEEKTFVGEDDGDLFYVAKIKKD